MTHTLKNKVVITTRTVEADGKLPGSLNEAAERIRFTRIRRPSFTVPPKRRLTECQPVWLPSWRLFGIPANTLAPVEAVASVGR